MPGPGHGEDAEDDLVFEGDPDAVDNAIADEEEANTPPEDDKDD